MATAIRSRLLSLGYAVEERPFAFSTMPGRHGALAAGLTILATVPPAAFTSAWGLRAATAGLLLVPAVLGLLCVGLADRMILGFPFGRAAGANLLARPAGGSIRFLVVAHRDSKSQPLPLILRVTGAVLSAVAWMALATALASGTPHPSIALIAGVAGGVGGILVACCGVGNESDGALDNASGVAALLRIARIEAEAGSDDVAFLVTDAEELGLAGARAAARSSSGAEVDGLEAVINLDGLDDEGPIVLIEGRSPLPHPPSRLTWCIDQAAAAHEVNVRHRGLPPGLLLDHIPFARAGMQSITVLRGGARSLARVHRPSDSVERLAGTGAARVARVLSDALARLRSHSPVPRTGVARELDRG